MTRNNVLRKALEFVERPETRPHSGQKTVGENFIDWLLKWNRLAVRSVKKFTMKIEDEIEDAAQKLNSYMFRLLGTKRITFVLNFDEVPLSVSGRMGKIKTIASIDDKYVRVSFDPNDNKRCGNGILGVGVFFNASLAACKVFQIPPYILFKGEPKTAAILAEQQFECCDFLPGFIPAGFTAWLQFVDTDVACTYRKHHGDIYDVGPEPKTAKQKRAFLARAAMQAWSTTMSGVNVANSFANLGYLDLCIASLRCAPKYKFIQPNLGAIDMH